jgi:AcrR family transcriptional regulator
MSREQILEAAAHIFRQKGFHGASMQEIANAVNLRKASLYHHVSSKQEILLDLLDQAMDLVIEGIQKIVFAGSSPEDKLRKAIQSYLVALNTHPDLASVLLMDYRSLDDDLRARHQPRRDQFEKLWRDLIEEGVDRGIFRPTNLSIATKALLGSMHWSIVWYQPDGSMTIAEIADIFSDLILEGVLLDPGEY